LGVIENVVSDNIEGFFLFVFMYSHPPTLWVNVYCHLLILSQEIENTCEYFQISCWKCI